MEETSKVLASTLYFPSDLDSDKDTDLKKTVVLGKFLKIKQLNGFKSREKGEPVFDTVVICKIKVDRPKNGDIIAHQIIDGDAKSEALKKRFATAWAKFSKNVTGGKVEVEETTDADEEVVEEGSAAAKVAKAAGKTK